MITLKQLAQEAAEMAENHEEVWFGVDLNADQIVYANDTWSVGSNGDAEDYQDRDAAISALATSWQQAGVDPTTAVIE